MSTKEPIRRDNKEITRYATDIVVNFVKRKKKNTLARTLLGKCIISTKSNEEERCKVTHIRTLYGPTHDACKQRKARDT